MWKNQAQYLYVHINIPCYAEHITVKIPPQLSDNIARGILCNVF